MAVRALVRVNLAAIERNVAHLAGSLQGGARLCAVVKADGYGHGALQAARAALAGGADSIAVATAVEALALREAGLVGVPLLVMGAISREELPAALAAEAEIAVWDEQFLDDVLAAGLQGGPVRMHVKLDTGMGRLGTRDPQAALALTEGVLSSDRVELAGAMTHFATADGDLEFVSEQLSRFDSFVHEVRHRAPHARAHAANSAATLRVPASHYDFVRCGIAIYGCDPMNQDPGAHGLEPALELSSYVAAVKRAGPGDSAGYGRQFIAEQETWIATLPVGYGDGIRRGLTNNCDVLIGGRRYPLVGTVSMDNITVDLGRSTDVRPGDEAVIIGASGSERQSAEDIARRLSTINYEVTCGISARVPRVYHHDGRPVDG